MIHDMYTATLAFSRVKEATRPLLRQLESKSRDAAVRNGVGAGIAGVALAVTAIFWWNPLIMAAEAVVAGVFTARAVQAHGRAENVVDSKSPPNVSYHDYGPPICLFSYLLHIRHRAANTNHSAGGFIFCGSSIQQHPGCHCRHLLLPSAQTSDGTHVKGREALHPREAGH